VESAVIKQPYLFCGAKLNILNVLNVRNDALAFGILSITVYRIKQIFKKKKLNVYIITEHAFVL